ncbi:MAG: ABC transporter transmembrane domain-containing protein [Acidobacteriota bacterium]|nr:ABC transporter transmembrane domain-containing protein [Acidobacteriota bacterium]
MHEADNSSPGGQKKKKPLGLRGFLAISLRTMRPYTPALILILLALLIQTAFRIVVPLGYRQIFDEAIANSDQEQLFRIITVLLIGWAINVVAALVQDYFIATVGARSMNDIRISMFRHLQRLSEGFFARTNSGDLMSRFSNDLAVVETAYLRSIYTFVFSSMILVFSVIALFFMEWRLALMTFASLPVALIGPRVLGGKAQEKNYDRKEYEALVAGTLQETISSHAVVRAFGLGLARLEGFRWQLDRLAAKAVRAVFASSLVGRTSSLSVYLIQILIMSVGGFLAIQGFLSAGSLVGFVALLLNVANAANHVSSAVPDLLQGAAGMQRIQEFLAEGPVVDDDPNAAEVPRLNREMYFQNVHFSYSGEGPALTGINFRITAGESVALVGPSGCGKSTILKLMMRFYDPTSGVIFLDGRDVKHGHTESLRGQIGVVLQENKLFNTTLRENIRMGKLDAGDQEVEEAAKMAEIHDMIMAQPEQYDTVVGEGGGKLSGGQRQRIAIARAMVRDPSILILDEATSALDPGTEAAINKTLASYARTRTVVAATHRLGSVVDMDRILVMDKGRLVEEGNHETLMAMKGVYFELWRKQSGFHVSADGASVEITPERLQAIPLFTHLKESSLEMLSQSLMSEVIPEKRILFMKGDQGNRFYIIARGSVEVIISDDEERHQNVRWLSDGDFFGEMALLDNAPRNATVRTGTGTLLLSLSRKDFRELLNHEPELRADIETEARRRRGTEYAYEEDESWGGGMSFKL